jgi:hypothetical protein
MLLELDKLNWVPSYINGKAGITGIVLKKRIPGLYFIKENDVLVYIGKSAYNVKQVLYRHFQQWNPDRTCRHYRVSYEKGGDYQVAVHLFNQLEVHDAEILNIQKYQPRDNRKLYENEVVDFPF